MKWNGGKNQQGNKYLNSHISKCSQTHFKTIFQPQFDVIQVYLNTIYNELSFSDLE